MSLKSEDRKHYRSIGHHLRPIILIGSAGLSEAVLTEISRALDDHELIKLKIASEDREARAALIVELVAATGAELVQSLGRTVLIVRRVAQPHPRLSNILRHSGGA